MDIKRIKQLRRSLKKEVISLGELIEIEEEFKKIPDSALREPRENAMAENMLDEIEEYTGVS
jgi:hypothetical protein